MQVSITLTPSSAAELREMLSVLSMHSPSVPIVSTVPPACQVQPMAKEEKHGPTVLEYLRESGDVRMKRTQEEIARHGDDKDAIARERLAAMPRRQVEVTGPPPADHATLDEDDL